MNLTIAADAVTWAQDMDHPSEIYIRRTVAKGRYDVGRNTDPVAMWNRADPAAA